MRCIVMVAVCAMFLIAAEAQNSGAPAGKAVAAAPAPPTPETLAKPGTPAEKAEAPAPKEPSRGDTIKLKSGSVLKDVQVIRRLPSQLEVQVAPDVILAIPRKQIESVEYDSIEPLTTLRTKPPAQVQTPSDLIPGDKINPELAAKLALPIPEPGLKFTNEDIVNLVAQLSRQLNLPIEIDESVKTIPVEQRTVSLDIKPGSNLTTVLQQDLLGKLKDLAVDYKFDSIVLVKKGATEATPPPTSPAPPPAEPAPAAPAQ